MLQGTLAAGDDGAGGGSFLVAAAKCPAGERDLHRCPVVVAPLGHYSRGQTRVFFASHVMGFFACWELLQLLVHGYPGGCKVGAALLITVF